MEYLLLLFSFAIILTGALLFTNAIEWLGHKLNLGEGAVGSILAAVGTAMPETLIPIVAIIGGVSGSDEVAVGAIVGAPFLLATIAMALVGISALAYIKRRPQGKHLDVHVETLDRDLVFFMIFFTLALVVGVVDVPQSVQIGGGVICLLAYVYYVVQTIRNSGDVAESHEMDPLIMDRRTDRTGGPPNSIMIIQLLVGLASMVGGAHLFVHELLSVAEHLGVSAIILSLILAPLATELPEKANSFFWVRDGKDALALGNITGAMVFQSTIPVAIGMIFIDWSLDKYAVLSMLLGLAGGVVAYWSLRRNGQFNKPSIAIWGLLYLTFLAFVILSGDTGHSTAH
ncbi:MAG TPA: sodium:calcium antiporter [Solirubrobacterales bacterium]|jgi:cation:H+ antiporter|nr:sodium:calcium antiporter [Solirubrobacterales bacterium]HMU26306.1 sodium:calcium antiporter [Solirubrobacterales bacterium]HMX70348.1 sodium:calcium antiporter [Solirubrobacterales bacterium]HMY24760.1 sodium:calcium antiporter [Solirubrobacterales bacterium]HNA23729.1 sodium:calcium antiporter [Solirubrobacterales bacterium]